LISGPQDCSDIQAGDGKGSGVYTIRIGGRGVNVYCDLSMDDGAWTVSNLLI